MINVVNKSTRVTNGDVKAMVRAIAYQLRYHAAPLWGKLPVPVVYLSDEKAAQPGSWVVVVMDDSDQADALGYHTESSGEVIWGRVFASPVLDHGGDALHKPLSVASVLSHECLEALADPNVNLWADTGTGKAVALEIGDPVENDSYAVPVHGAGDVTVSNFVTPQWFDPQAKSGDRFDYLGRVAKPFEMTKGGYVVVLQEGKMTQQYGEHYPEWRKAPKNSPLARTRRRMTLWSSLYPEDGAG